MPFYRTLYTSILGIAQGQRKPFNANRSKLQDTITFMGICCKASSACMCLPEPAEERTDHFWRRCLIVNAFAWGSTWDGAWIDTNCSGAWSDGLAASDWHMPRTETIFLALVFFEASSSELLVPWIQMLVSSATRTKMRCWIPLCKKLESWTLCACTWDNTPIALNRLACLSLCTLDSYPTIWPLSVVNCENCCLRCHWKLYTQCIKKAQQTLHLNYQSQSQISSQITFKKNSCCLQLRHVLAFPLFKLLDHDPKATRQIRCALSLLTSAILFIDVKCLRAIPNLTRNLCTIPDGRRCGACSTCCAPSVSEASALLPLPSSPPDSLARFLAGARHRSLRGIAKLLTETSIKNTLCVGCVDHRT